MTTAAPARTQPKKRRWLLWTGIVLLQLLLMGAAFVGGRMVGAQNQRGQRPLGSVQLPSQLPKEPAAGSGTVQKIQDTVITLAGRGFGGQQGGGQQATTTEVAFTADTKFYMNTAAGGPGNPGGGQPQITVADATSADVKVGSNVTVWGTKNGARITAEVVYIQSSGR
ncbi:MAG TPA: hypothetical protein VF478_03635 [Anaerolineae bacterium]